MTPDTQADQARAFFPRGLEQPEGRFRFSMDALLLASFAGGAPWKKALDCGTGCGVVGLALLLLQGDGRVLGVDRDSDMCRAAQANAALLGLERHFHAAHLDLRRRDAQWRELVPPGSFDLVVANPPYRAPDSGRRNPGAAVQAARFELAAVLEDFVNAARAACANRMRFCLVYLAERLPLACAALEHGGFAVKRILPVHSRACEPAKLALLEARKQGGAGCELAPPLVLYQGWGQDTRLTEQALAFCPFLACNARDHSHTTPGDIP